MSFRLFVWFVWCAVRGDGVTIGKGERVSRTILRFAAFSSAALILKGNYFSEKRKTEKPGHPAFPKSVFFLTGFPETVQSKRSAETVDRYTAQKPLVVPTSRCV
jgi:hypothetical protein